MEFSDLISIIIGVLGIGGVIFTIYNSVKNPQTKIEKDQIRAEEDLKDKASLLSQKEVENKAAVLEKQFQWYMDATEKKFGDFGKRLEDAFLMASNHTHTVDVKVDKLIDSVNCLNTNITRLQTIIEERTPKK